MWDLFKGSIWTCRSGRASFFFFFLLCTTAVGFPAQDKARPGFLLKLADTLILKEPQEANLHLHHFRCFRRKSAQKPHLSSVPSAPGHPHMHTRIHAHTHTHANPSVWAVYIWTLYWQNPTESLRCLLCSFQSEPFAANTDLWVETWGIMEMQREMLWRRLSRVDVKAPEARLYGRCDVDDSGLWVTGRMTWPLASWGSCQFLLPAGSVRGPIRCRAVWRHRESERACLMSRHYLRAVFLHLDRGACGVMNRPSEVPHCTRFWSVFHSSGLVLHYHPGRK